MRAVRLNLIGLGLLLGLGLGLVYGLVLSPVEFTNTSPADLRSDYQEQYIIMTAAAYHADGDLQRALNRLSALGLTDPAETVTALAQRAAAQQRDEQMVAWLGELAFALGAVPAPVTVSAEQAAKPTDTPIPAPSTPTAALLTPTPTATAAPTPTATPIYDYSLVSQETICDAVFAEPLLQVEVVDEQGEALPGVLVVVTWPGGEDRFYTGLKPDISPGYGDFTMKVGETYAVQVGSRTPPITGLTTETCTDEQGMPYPGSVLVRLQRGG